MIVDYSAGYPGGAALRAAGVESAARYLRKRTPSRVNVLTPTEVMDLRAHDIAIVPIYEDVDPARMLSAGYSGGVTDARQASADASTLGISLRAVYFTADTAVSATLFSVIDNYLRGAASVLGIARVGIYGERALIEHCQRVQSASWYFQPVAWSVGTASDIHLYQGGDQTTINGVLCDIDTSSVIDYGQWPAPAGTGDLDVINYMVEYVRDSSGKIYEANLVSGTYWHIPNPSDMRERQAQLAAAGISARSGIVSASDMAAYGVQLGQ